MTTFLRPFFFLLALTAVFPSASSGAEEEDPTAKFREALRGTMLQLREAQAKTAEMEAASVRAQMEADKAKKEVSSLQSQLLEERASAANQATELRAAVAQREEKIASFEAQVAKWRKDFAALQTDLRKAQAETARVKGRIATLERTVAEQQVKNVEMKQTADEILDRYSGHSFGRTLLAREPFISVNRAKLQTIMQDLETRIRAAALPAATNAPATASPVAGR